MLENRVDNLGSIMDSLKSKTINEELVGIDRVDLWDRIKKFCVMQNNLSMHDYSRLEYILGYLFNEIENLGGGRVPRIPLISSTKGSISSNGSDGESGPSEDDVEVIPNVEEFAIPLIVAGGGMVSTLYMDVQKFFNKSSKYVKKIYKESGLLSLTFVDGGEYDYWSVDLVRDSGKYLTVIIKKASYPEATALYKAGKRVE